MKVKGIQVFAPQDSTGAFHSNLFNITLPVVNNAVLMKVETI